MVPPCAVSPGAAVVHGGAAGLRELTLPPWSLSLWGEHFVQAMPGAVAPSCPHPPRVGPAAPRWPPALHYLREQQLPGE